jgi:ribonuclease HII
LKRPDLSYETPLWQQSGVFVFGVDEAGRGCLAGPVCAAVACWEPLDVLPVDVRDSKQMTEAQREACFEPVKEKAFAYGVGFASCSEIDRWNIVKANCLALARAIESALQMLQSRNQGTDKFVFLVDGNYPLVSHARFFVGHSEYAQEFPLAQALFKKGFQEICVVKGDSKVFSIASASVLAKVSRDRHMHELDRAFPGYEFAAHKGYSTAKHVALLRELGPCSEHRKTFAPVTEAMALFPQA